MNIINHPCQGKDCRLCETCIYDEPIPDNGAKSPKALDKICNYCGYLVKSYKEHGDVKFNACCGKHIIESGDYVRPRTIRFNVEGDNEDIPKPDWCPKVLSNSPSPTVTIAPSVSNENNSGTTPPSSASFYESFTERRKVLSKLPSHLEWDDFKEGELYVIPRIINQKVKVVKIIDKNDYTIRCIVVNDNGQESNYYHNVYKQDLDAKFIVKYHNF